MTDRSRQAAAGSGTLNAHTLLAQRVSATLTAGSIMLALALAVVAVLIVPIRRAEPVRS